MQNVHIPPAYGPVLHSVVQTVSGMSMRQSNMLKTVSSIISLFDIPCNSSQMPNHSRTDPSVLSSACRPDRYSPLLTVHHRDVHAVTLPYTGQFCTFLTNGDFMLDNRKVEVRTGVEQFCHPESVLVGFP